MDWGGPPSRRDVEPPVALCVFLGAARRLPWGISPRSALRLSVRGSPHAPAARTAPRGVSSPSVAGLTRGPPSPGLPGGFLGPSAPSLRGGSCPDFSPGSPLARGVSVGRLPESGHGSALGFPALGPCVMVWCVQRRAVSARAVLGLVLVFPRFASHHAGRGRFGCPSRFASGGASVAKRRGGGLLMVGAGGVPLCVRPPFGPFGPSGAVWGFVLARPAG